MMVLAHMIPSRESAKRRRILFRLFHFVLCAPVSHDVLPYSLFRLPSFSLFLMVLIATGGLSPLIGLLGNILHISCCHRQINMGEKSLHGKWVS